MKEREQELSTEVRQNPVAPIISAKRTYRGEPAELIYFCGGDDRLTSRTIYLRYPDANSAELAFNRHLAATIEELGYPCVGEGPPPGETPPDTDFRRTVVWNVRPGYEAILFFFNGNASRPWQVQLYFNALTHIEISERTASVWRDHGCQLPIPGPDDPRAGKVTLIIP